MERSTVDMKQKSFRVALSCPVTSVTHDSPSRSAPNNVLMSRSTTLIYDVINGMISIARYFIHMQIHLYCSLDYKNLLNGKKIIENGENNYEKKNPKYLCEFRCYKRTAGGILYKPFLITQIF